MTVTLFITLLAFFSTITSLCTEGLKKLFCEHGLKYSSNLIAIVVACIVGTLGTGAYYIIYSIPFTAVNIVCIFLMGCASAVCAMVGYDKVVQTIQQIKIKKTIE